MHSAKEVTTHYGPPPSILSFMLSFFFQHSFIIYTWPYDFLVFILSHIHPTSPLHHIPSWLCHAHNYIACTYMHARTHCPITCSTCSEQLFRSHKSWDDEIFHFYSPLLCTIPLTQPLPSHIAINCTSYIAVKGAVRGSAQPTLTAIRAWSTYLQHHVQTSCHRMP